MRWRFGRRSLDLSGSVALMGIVNVTPDSFSDGGRFLEPRQAVDHGARMAEAGATFLDVGGESTRPGAMPVAVDEELSRVVPVLEGLRSRVDVILSVDTRKPEVAAAALAAGAEVVNDVSALEDPRMAALVARHGAGAVLMHMRGQPQTMQQGDLRCDDVGATVVTALAARVEAAVAAGVARESLCVDPGIGFGKTPDQNLDLLDDLPRLAALGLPILVGVSRKAFLGHLTGRPVHERGFATAAACTWAVARGAHVLRVHDVAEMRDVARVAAALRSRRS